MVTLDYISVEFLSLHVWQKKHLEFFQTKGHHNNNSNTNLFYLNARKKNSLLTVCEKKRKLWEVWSQSYKRNWVLKT